MIKYIFVASLTFFLVSGVTLAASVAELNKDRQTFQYKVLTPQGPFYTNEYKKYQTNCIQTVDSDLGYPIEICGSYVILSNKYKK